MKEYREIPDNAEVIGALAIVLASYIRQERPQDAELVSNYLLYLLTELR